jgi:hypothetical protein
VIVTEMEVREEGDCDGDKEVQPDGFPQIKDAEVARLQ